MKCEFVLTVLIYLIKALSIFLLFTVQVHLVFIFRERVNWMLQYQGMVVLAVNQIWWTWEVEDVFNKVRHICGGFL